MHTMGASPQKDFPDLPGSATVLIWLQNAKKRDVDMLSSSLARIGEGDALPHKFNLLERLMKQGPILPST